ncbi:MAG: AAA family ATPase [Sandaracinus sp.]
MILTLRLKSFRRYGDETLELGPGVSFIEGDNNAGKTSLFYAIEYALFGRVTGHKSLAALMAPKAKAMGVELVLRGVDGHRWRLQRMHVLPPRSRKTTIGHFTLKRSARPLDAPAEEGVDPSEETYVVSSDFADREEALALALSKALGVSRRYFDVAVHIRQGAITQILEGPARELDIVLGVTAAVAAADEMRAMALEREKEASQLPLVEETLRAMERDQEGGAAELTRLDAELAELSVKERSFVDEAASVRLEEAGLAPRLAARDALDRARQEHARAKTALEDARAAAPPELGSAPSEPVQDDREREAREARLEAAREARAAREKEQRALDARRGDLAARIGRREEHAHAGAGARCESCGQPIDAALAAREIEGWRAELATLEGLSDALTAELAERSDTIASLRDEVRREAEARARREAEAERFARARELLSGREQAFARSEQALSKASEDVRPFLVAAGEAADVADPDRLSESLGATIDEAREALRDRRARIDAERAVSGGTRARLEAQRAMLSQRVSQAERELARTRSSVETLREAAAVAARLRVLGASFQELQAVLRERAATALAKEALEIHRALQGGGESELGELRLDPESYAMLVTPKDVGREVPASAAQGGGHRLLLGLALALSIGRVVGRPPFLMLDEPTYGLDRERRRALLARIAELGLTDQILLITHHETENVGGKHVRVVRKGKQSRLEVLA